MRIVFVLLIFTLINWSVSAQTIGAQLQKAYAAFEADPQLKHAISSLYVVDASTGKAVFDKNSQVGLAPASTQKIITAVTAFELLGKDYRYKTYLVYDGRIENGVLDGNLYLAGSGDPTLGSWRWDATKDSNVLAAWLMDIKNAGIRSIKGNVWFLKGGFSAKTIPDGWIWQDIGNYYGAGAQLLNWKENQYDIVLRSGEKVGGEVDILSPQQDYVNELKAAGRGSGDNAYVYYNQLIAGTIPVGQRSFSISASQPNPPGELCVSLAGYLNSRGIDVEPREQSSSGTISTEGVQRTALMTTIAEHRSPSLDSIVYWFLQKSINLYGEAIIKTLAIEKKDLGSTDLGVDVVKNFWKSKWIDEDELNISDGSGLSPQNRVTTHAQVEILRYAKQRSWFSYFYNALPVYNNMKMKSGTIRDVKGFCGYQKAANGKEYIFSFLVNNYSGTSSALVGKMYRVLDLLK